MADINSLITRLQEGDSQALSVIYDDYSGALYGVILRMCKDENRAQDLLQETFVKIWKNAKSYDPAKGKFYTWAYRIARNTTLNGLRNSAPLIQTEDLGVYEDKVVSENFEHDHLALSGSINNLEPHHQRAIELVYFQGFTHREAHEEMQVPLGTFKSYIQQALKKLRESYHLTLLTVCLLMERML